MAVSTLAMSLTVFLTASVMTVTFSMTMAVLVRTGGLTRVAGLQFHLNFKSRVEFLERSDPH